MYSLVRKIQLCHTVVDNWPLVGLSLINRRDRLMLYRIRNGLVFACRARSTDLAEVVAILSGREYPPEFLNLSEDSVVLDVGANIGAFGIFLGMLNHDIEFRGFAIEPLHSNVRMCRTNLALNDETRFEVEELAFGGDSGLATIVGAENYDAATVELSHSGTVTMSRISEYCQDRGLNRIALLKMDCEGAEHDIARADLDFLKSSVVRIVAEVHDQPPDKSAKTFAEQLSGAFDLRNLGDGIWIADNRSL